jgi:hypothetical protein
VPPSSSSIDGDALVQGAQFQAFSQAPCHVCRSGYATADWPADWRFWFHGSPRENSRVIEGEEWQYQWLPTRTCRVVGVLRTWRKNWSWRSGDVQCAIVRLQGKFHRVSVESHRIFFIFSVVFTKENMFCASKLTCYGGKIFFKHRSSRLVLLIKS